MKFFALNSVCGSGACFGRTATGEFEGGEDGSGNEKKPMRRRRAELVFYAAENTAQ